MMQRPSGMSVYNSVNQLDKIEELQRFINNLQNEVKCLDFLHNSEVEA